MSANPVLLFVYNADTGLFNTLADIGHKIFSPKTYSCDLCQLTHGYFTERAAWQAFVAELDVKCRFLHRDEFHEKFPDRPDVLPAIFIQEENKLSLCIDSVKLQQYEDIDELVSAVREHCLMNPDVST
jgi:hypothetical protein